MLRLIINALVIMFTSSECSVMVVLMSPLSLACCSASWWRNTKILGILAVCYSLCGSVIVIQSLPVATNTGLTPSDDRGQVEILKVELRWAAQCCCLGRFSLFPSNIPLLLQITGRTSSVLTIVCVGPLCNWCGVHWSLQLVEHMPVYSGLARHSGSPVAVLGSAGDCRLKYKATPGSAVLPRRAACGL